MKKKLWIAAALLLILPGMLLTVSCQSRTQVQQPTEPAEPGPTTDVTTPTTPEEPMEPSEPMIDTEDINERERMAMRNRFMNEDVYFEFDSSSLMPAAQRMLRMKADWLANNPDDTVIIEGHCDERGTNEYNLALGDRRAESCKAFLVNLGIASSRITTISYGEERPVDRDSNEEAWAKNRRAHFVIE